MNSTPAETMNRLIWIIKKTNDSLLSAMTGFQNKNFHKACENIRITPWGPYDFRYPMLWLKEIDSNQLYHFEVLGPAGIWSVADSIGFNIIQTAGNQFPAEIIAKIDPTIHNRKLRLNYQGPAFKDQFGQIQSAESSHGFDFQEFAPGNVWKIQWHPWDSLTDPNKDYSSFLQSLEKAPIKQINSDKLDFTWWGKIGPNLPADSFATVATTTMDLPKAVYEIGITADDLVKLWIDGKEMINAWDAKAAEYDEYNHHSIQITLEGKHEFKILHVEKQGLASLQFYLQPLR